MKTNSNNALATAAFVRAAVKGQADTDHVEAKRTGSSKSSLQSAWSNWRSRVRVTRELLADDLRPSASRPTEADWGRPVLRKQTPRGCPVTLCGGSQVSVFHLGSRLSSGEGLTSVHLTVLIECFFFLFLACNSRRNPLSSTSCSPHK